MQIRSIRRGSVLLFCFLLPCSQSSSAFSFECRTSDIGEAIAATALFVGAVALLSLDDYESSSHDNFCSNIDGIVDDMSYDYHDELAIVEQECSSCCLYASDVNEVLLYRLAVAKRDKSSVSRYLKTLNKDIKRLHKAHNKLDKQGYPRNLRSSLKNLLNKLSRLSDIVTVHTAYFELYEMEDAIWRDYKKELALLYDARLSYSVLTTQLRDVVRRHCNTWWDAYPYMTYVSKLRDTIDKLHNSILVTPGRYHERVGAAQELIDRLYVLETLVIADPKYEYELCLKY